MARNKSEVYLHFVWATWDRLELLTGRVERAAHGAIRAECAKLGCRVMALGGMPDHVHLAVEMPTTVTIADVMQNVKGISSTVARREAAPEFFGWQDGYGVFSFSRSQIKVVQQYIDNQKQHHADRTFWPVVEEIGTDRDRISLMEPPTRGNDLQSGTDV